jgi:hypothetical protein
MKKTLIAAGIAAAVAAPAVFADVKVGGSIETQFVKKEFTTSANNGTEGTDDNFITFTASEDLGNGLTAFAKMMITGTGSTKDQIVGLKGGFGTVVTGYMEDFTESKVQGRMTLESDIGASGILEANTDYGSRNHGVAYVTPTVNGLHAGVAAYFDSSLNGSSGADAYDVAVFYDNGPLSIAVAQETIKGLASGGSSKDAEVLSISASYTMGDLKATVLRTSSDNTTNSDTNDSDDTSYRLDYKMGNNAITLGYKDDETDAGAKGNDVWVVEMKHNFSKQTSIYASYADIDDNSSATVADYEAKVGLKHSF